MASCKATDGVYHVDPPAPAKKLRELFYCAHFIHSHIAHFYALAAPDFVLGPEADPAQRNILGVVAKVGIGIGGEVIKHRAYAQQIQGMLAGKATHPTWGLPGGVSKGFNEDERKQVEEMAKSCVEFGKFSLTLFEDVVLKNKEYVDLILSSPYQMTTYYMGLVDARDKVSFYDGQIKVVDPECKEFARFAPSDYLSHIREHVEPWSYLKFPFLKNVGWKGLVGGKDSGVYRVAPMARLNVASGMATPLAQEAYEKLFATLGGKPVGATLANHWARLVELVYAAERMHQLSVDPEITSPNYRVIPSATPTEGVGVVEAPRGTLIHHYKTDANGIVTEANLIVATGHNHGPICMAVKSAAQGVIQAGSPVREGLLNKIEMAFRAYDPCFACATHSLPGEMPLEVNIYNSDGAMVDQIARKPAAIRARQIL